MLQKKHRRYLTLFNFSFSYMKLKSFFLIGMFLPLHVFAQSIKEFSAVAFPTPNAAALGLYGKIPVSLFTGTPNISIPLYEVRDGDITIPIQLSYHASGVRPEEQPSWTGLGWSLQAGGAVTRIVHKFPDEADDDYWNDGWPGHPGYYYNYGLLSSNDWYSYANAGDAELHNKDLEPDEFSFNFNGYSGSFYLDHTGNWKVKSDDDIKVEPINPGTDLKSVSEAYAAVPMFYQFRLIAPDGKKYIFGVDKTAIELTRPKYNDPYGKPVATTWYLTKIISPDERNSVELSYIRGNLNMQVSFTQHMQRNSVSGGTWIMPYSCTGTDNGVWNHGCQVLEPSFLRSITTSNAKIVFMSNVSNDLRLVIPTDIVVGEFLEQDNPTGGYKDITDHVNMAGVANYHIDPCAYNGTPNSDSKYLMTYMTERKKLSGIYIYDRNTPHEIIDNCWKPSSPPVLDAGPSKVISFEYIEDGSKRLMLSKIVETGGSDHKKEHTFSYFDDSSIELPAYCSFQIDHWGFYNGKISKQVYDPVAYTALRDPNTQVKYALEGTLRKIGYPTGGTTEFEFEPHSYSEEFHRINLPGGEEIDAINIATLGVNKAAGGLRVKRITSTPGQGGAAQVSEYFYVNNYPGNSTSGLSSGVLSARPQYYWNADLYSLDYSNNPVGYFSYFSSSSTLPLMANQENHIMYREVVERRSDGSYTRQLFTMPQKIDPAVDPIPAEYQDIKFEWSVGNGTYDKVNSMSQERGKLKVSEIYNASHQLQYKKEYSFNSDPNRFEQYVRSRDWHILESCDNLGRIDHGSAIRIYTYPFYMSQETETNYLKGTAKLVTSTAYTYTLYKQVRTSTIVDSDGSSLVTLYLYPYDYTDAFGFIKGMKDNHVFLPIEKVVYRQLANGSKYVLSGEIIKYKADALGKTDEILVLEHVNGQSTSLASFRFSNQVLVNTIPNGAAVSVFSPQNSTICRYISRAQNEIYETAKNNLVQFKDAAGLTNAIIWGYNNALPSAKISNAAFAESAYTGFESSDKGNWTYTGNILLTLASKAGTGHYNLTAGSISRAITAGKYRLEYWAKAPVTITGGTVSDISTSPADANGWKLYQKAINVASGSVQLTIAGATAIDELRVYPAAAQMTTYTYQPLFGITSMMDPNGQITYYEYDGLFRLKVIKDQYGNILKAYDYRYQAKY
jgi:hypothetical protein